MTAPGDPRRRGRAAFLLLLLGVVALGFAYGLVAGRRGFPPYPQLAALFRTLRGDAETPRPEEGPRKAVEQRMESGWYEIIRQPGGPSHEEIMDRLSDVGYLDSYRAAGDEGGVLVHDAERAQPGTNLVVSAHGPEVLLMDMEGEELHKWRYAYDDIPGEWQPKGKFGVRYFRRAHLLPDGELLGLFERSGLVRLDRDSNLLWGLRGQYHHDLDVTADGRIHVLFRRDGLIPRIHPTRPTFEDFVTTLSPEGEELSSLSLLEMFENSRYASLLESADPKNEDLFHTNTIDVFEGEHAHLSPLFSAGKALISLRSLDVIAIVDLEERTVDWALAGMWHGQHEPALLDDGNILVFDNLGHHGMSKVIEIEPFTQRIVWAYEGNAENDFKTTLCGSNQRLANGNTLITESLSGRAFEVTREGDVVWKWFNPNRAGPNGEGVAVLMEVVRLDPAVHPWLDE